MKTIIFEGIATSGKSTVINLLKSSLDKRLKIKVADERVTHIPIMKSTNELHVDFYKELINKLSRNQPDLLILDRLYLTQAYRAKTDLLTYKEIENVLKPLNPVTIFLYVEPASIKDRVLDAIGHREPAWGEYVSTKGRTSEEQAEYYINQQESLIELLKRSTLPYQVLDTTAHNYNAIVKTIVTYLDLNQNNRGGK